MAKMEEDTSGACCGVTFYLAIVAATLMLYLAYKKLVDNDNWEKYGVKTGNLPITSITRLRDGFGKILQEYGDTVGLKKLPADVSDEKIFRL